MRDRRGNGGNGKHYREHAGRFAGVFVVVDFELLPLSLGPILNFILKSGPGLDSDECKDGAGDGHGGD